MANKHLVFWLVALGVLVLDRISKLLVLAYLPLGSSVGIFTHVRNTGTFFGLAKGAGIVLGLFAAIVCIYILLHYRRFDAFGQKVAGLVFAGAAGNLIDRLVYGSVIDFIDLTVWPVFNVADSAITIAIALLLIDAFREWRNSNI